MSTVELRRLGLILAITVCAAAPAFAQSDSWIADVAVANVASTSTISGAEYSSSTLRVSWVPYPQPHPPVLFYRVSAVDGITGEVTIAAGGGSPITLSELKASTTYTVDLRACYNLSCTGFATAIGGYRSRTTYPETWQIAGGQGPLQSLHCSYTYPIMGFWIVATRSCDIVKVVADGGSKAAAYMDAAGNAYLYYDPSPGAIPPPVVDGVSVGSAPAAALQTVTTYNVGTTYYGLDDPSPQSGLVKEVDTSEPVPLAGGLGNVRLFFEGLDTASGHPYSRVLTLDSAAGTNNDFNSTADTFCSVYTATGSCPPAVAVAIEPDDTFHAAGIGHYGIESAHQLRVGYNRRDGGWNLADGTFMIFTVNLTRGYNGLTNCQGAYGWTDTTVPWLQGYAQSTLSGARWDVLFDTGFGHTGCPKVFEDMQAPSLVHRGGVRHKLYFGTPSETTGRTSCSDIPGPGQPFLGPKRMLYANGALTGSATTVEYTDWEPKTTQRDMQFAWPDGSILSPQAEGYIDDFEFLMDPSDPTKQHAYLTITDGYTTPSCAAPFITYARLVNP